jgi:predicted pyridoxine 5'-phosphate oxidase superfamily flavin-nucleotide-binding protein
MRHTFGRLAFTPAVRAAQRRDGARVGDDPTDHGPFVPDQLGDDELEFLEAQRSVYLATVSETGWPYVQHRGGPPGFLKVLDPRTIGFADFAGNRQLITVGNVSVDDRVAMIAVDYAQRVRLKVLGHLAVRDVAPDDPLAERLRMPGYRGRVQRLMTITVEAFDWNCPQHIPQRLDAEDVARALAHRDARIAELEAKLAAVGNGGTTG